jgi:hypothetical protein
MAVAIETPPLGSACQFPSQFLVQCVSKQSGGGSGFPNSLAASAQNILFFERILPDLDSPF